MSEAPIRLGLIGAGLFAQNAHTPSLLALPQQFEVVAIASRRLESAQALADSYPNPPVAYDDIEAVLARPDIDAVDIALPIYLQHEWVERALQAGKHVISEKPIAPSLAEGQALLQRVASYRAQQVWMVAENWRYEPAFLLVRDLLAQGRIGQVVFFDWSFHIHLHPENKYYQTSWRRDNSHPGGFILDGGVHHVAALRLMFGEVQELSAVARLTNPNLPPVDTLVSHLQFENGVLGSYAISYTVASPWNQAARIVGTEGAIEVRPGQVVLSQGDTSETYPLESTNTVQKALADFARTIRQGAPTDSPEEGLQDVAVIEAMLVSAETRQWVAPTRVR